MINLYEHSAAPSVQPYKASTLHSWQQKGSILSPISPQQNEQDALKQIVDEMEQRRTDLGYGLGIFIGRNLGLRDGGAISQEPSLLEGLPKVPLTSFLQKMIDCFKPLKYYFSSSEEETATSSLCPLKLMEAYQIVEEIGIGAKGTLNSALDTATGEIVALKIDHIPLEEMTSEMEVKIQRDTIREVTALHHFNRLRGCGTYSDVQGKQHRFMASELIVGNDIAKFLYSTQEKLISSRNLDELKKYFDKIFKIVYLVCTEVQHYHNEGFVHRDIKLENLIIDDTNLNMVVKLVDFGGMVKAKDIETDMDNQFGSLFYLAPELTYAKPNFLSDTYSVGKCIDKLIDILDSGSFLKLRHKLNYYELAYQELSTIANRLSAETPSDRMSLSQAILKLDTIRADNSNTKPNTVKFNIQ